LSVLGGFSHWDLPKPRDCEKGCVVMFKLAMQELLRVFMIKKPTKIKIWKFRGNRGVLLILLETPWWIWEPPSNALHEYACTKVVPKVSDPWCKSSDFLTSENLPKFNLKKWFPPMQRIFFCKNETNSTEILI
jgi:hypothetical protein